MPSQEKTQPQKRKGAPLGNFNALKHGFYSRRYREYEITDLESAASGQNLRDEITLLKVMIRRVFEMAEDEDENSLKNWIKVLSVCGAAMARQAILLRTQLIVVGGKSDDVAKAISQAISEVTREISVSS